MKEGPTYSRVIIEKLGVRRRLCSLHINLNSGDLFIEFKKPLAVIAQGTFDARAGKIALENPEVKKIQHIHYIHSKHKIVMTYREKGKESQHTKGLTFVPKKINGRYLHMITRILPRDADLLIHNKTLTSMDYPLKVPDEAVNERLAYDLWFGFRFDPVQVDQASHQIRRRYENYESKFYVCAFGDNGPFSVYIVMYLPKNQSVPDATRIMIPRTIN